MVELYSGTPGSGKSLHVAQRIYDSLKFKKQNVIANFDINLDEIKNPKAYFTHVDNWELTPEYLTNYAHLYHVKDKRGKIIENQTLIVIDECQIIFNSRTSIRVIHPAVFFMEHEPFHAHTLIYSIPILDTNKYLSCKKNTQ